MSHRTRDEVAHVRTRREWIVLGIGVIVVAVLCLVAGRWQWNRHVTRNAAIEITVANYDADPVPLTDLLPGPGTVLPTDEVWRPVSMTGTYRIEATVLLRNRPVASTAGFHALVPFETDSGIVIIVDRGFIPMGADGSAPTSVPEPAHGETNVVARLRADEKPPSRGAPSGQIQAINTAAVLETGASGVEWAQGRTVGAYAALISESPAAAEPLFGLAKPDTEPGSHLSYAFQWAVFAAGAIGGFLILLRRERREAIRREAELAGPDAALPQDTPADVAAWISGARPSPEGVSERRTVSDEDAEDAQLDAQGYH